MKLYEIVLLISSLIPLGYGIYCIIEYQKFKDKSIPTKARIVNVTKKVIDAYDDKFMYYFPIISFSDLKGKQHTVELETGVGNSKKYKLGALLEIFYNRENPNEVKIMKTSSMWFPISLFVISLIFIIIALTGIL